jgi:hypothetical protein
MWEVGLKGRKKRWEVLRYNLCGGINRYFNTGEISQLVKKDKMTWKGRK